MSDTNEKRAVNSDTNPEGPAERETSAQTVPEVLPKSGRDEQVFLLTRETFERMLSEGTRSIEDNVAPTTSVEFRAIIEDLERGGWQWSTDDPPSLMRKPSANQDPDVIARLSKKYPGFPRELGAVIRNILFGWPADARIVGDASELSEKAKIAIEMFVTDEYRSRFFFQHATKARRFQDLDWEIMMKAAERNIDGVPATIHANITLETATWQPDDDDEIRTTTFAADAHALQAMIETLQDALKALEKTQRLAQAMRNEQEHANVK